MLPEFTPAGLLPPGVHAATWAELSERFGGNFRRRDILQGVSLAAASLKGAGCQRLWLDGSFVTHKRSPNDWDGCWDPVGVNPAQLDSVFWDPSPLSRRRMKTKYMADLFPASVVEGKSGLLFVNFFQVDKETGEPKGIVLLDLSAWHP